MKYSGSLVKEEREKIFSLFLHQDKLKFRDIEKAISIRSNMVAYHLKQMEKEGIIKKSSEKSGEHYKLTENGEKYLPIFSHVTGKEVGPVPVVLVVIVHKEKLLLMKRKNRPYKDYWSMIGGKMRLEESFDDASTRMVKEKTGLDSKFISLNAILHEKVHGEKVKHSFILFFTKVELMAKQKEKKKEKLSAELKWFSDKQLNADEIIPSDYWLLKNKINKKIAVFTADMNDEDGRMKNFKVKNVNGK